MSLCHLRRSVDSLGLDALVFFLKALLAHQMPRDRRLSRRRLQFDLQPQTGERGERSKKRGGRMGGSIAAVIQACALGN